MSKKRTELSELFHSVCDNVYYKDPRSKNMDYPCIKYDLADIVTRRANNSIYHDEKRYTVIYITSNPDDPLIDNMLRLVPKISFERQYKSGNLYHNVYEVYF